MDETLTEIMAERIFETKQVNRFRDEVEKLEYLFEPLISEIEELRKICDDYVR